MAASNRQQQTAAYERAAGKQHKAAKSSLQRSTTATYMHPTAQTACSYKFRSCLLLLLLLLHWQIQL
jgi:hypothetical protein